MPARKFKTVKEYHALIPKEIRARVEELRDTIAKANARTKSKTRASSKSKAKA